MNGIENLYKRKFQGGEEIPNLKKYAIGMDRVLFNSIGEIVEYIYKGEQPRIGDSIDAISFQKSYDIKRRDEEGFIVAKNLNILERTILKIRLKRRFRKD